MLYIRHGQSTWNEVGRWQGRADPPLSEFGEEQAHMAARSIGQVDAIVSSPLERALGTAAIIGTHIGVGPIQVVDDLVERDSGEWSGLTRQEIDEKWPGWVDSDRRPNGWENDASLIERSLRAIDAIVAEFAGATLVVLSHGGVIIRLEEHLGVNDARVPNLHGRIFTHDGEQLRAGEKLELLPEEMRTGGRSKRV